MYIQWTFVEKIRLVYLQFDVWFGLNSLTLETIFSKLSKNTEIGAYRILKMTSS